MADTQSSSNQSPQLETYAIVEASGQQFWLQANRYYDLDLIQADLNEVITLDKVLLLNDSGKVQIGKPYVENAKVQIKILEHRRGKKIIVYKMRPKKKTRRKSGHRQELTRVLVESISIGAKTTKQTEETNKSQKSSKVTKDSE